MNYEHLDDEIDQISLPEFFPNSNEIKEDFLTNYKNIEKLDEQIGMVIQQLKEDELYDHTIIFSLAITGVHFLDINDLFMILEFNVHFI